MISREPARDRQSAWEGPGRFSRGCCGVEPLVLTRAWRLVTEDPAAAALKLDPEATIMLCHLLSTPDRCPECGVGLAQGDISN